MSVCINIYTTNTILTEYPRAHTMTTEIPGKFRGSRLVYGPLSQRTRPAQDILARAMCFYYTPPPL